MARIKEKIKQGQTKEITKPESGGEGAPRSAQIIDLAELLQKSLGKATPPRKRSARGEAPPERSKPALSVVGSAKSSGKRVAKSAARRKRA
jgi:non-homologous end joining protein Ku